MTSMRPVVADTGPLNYLVLIGCIDLVPTLFGQVSAPRTVHAELTANDAPAPVRAWIARPPEWLHLHPDPAPSTNLPSRLDPGEQATIRLALAISASLVLMDDRDAVSVARRLGLAATGTLGILDLAARRGLTDLSEAFTRLKATSFYYRQGLLDAILAKHLPREP